MAQDWIKMRTDLDTDPRVLRISFALKVADVDLLIGKLWRLWKYADTHTVDGQIRFMTAEVLDHIIGLSGFTAALCDVGWLEVIEDGVRIPRFDEHNSESAKHRANDALRKRFNRKNGDASPSSDTPSKDSPAGANPQRAGQPSPNSRTPPGRVSEERPEKSGHGSDAGRTEPGSRRDETRRDEKFVKSESNGGPTKVGQSSRPEQSEHRFSLDAPAFDSLFARILEVTGEKDTRATRSLYRGYVELIGPAGIERAMSSTRQRAAAAHEGKLRNPGGYFNKTCRNIAEEMGVATPKRGAA